MGILRITMRKTSSQRVSGAFTVLSLPLDCGRESGGVKQPEVQAIAPS
jgi:hypothetical protein